MPRGRRLLGIFNTSLEELLRLVKEHLSKYWDDEIEENYRTAEKLLNELKS